MCRCTSLSTWSKSGKSFICSLIELFFNDPYIVATQGFKHTETYQQLISYAGLSPREYSSGSNIRGKVRICKQGGSLMRHTLYMCAVNAKETNGVCKDYLTG
ncbi:MAG: IS110 family transposase [Niastella sp.]|nr:IS110 family transposase [Niastella sp.]